MIYKMNFQKMCKIFQNSYLELGVSNWGEPNFVVFVFLSSIKEKYKMYFWNTFSVQLYLNC